MHFFLTVLISNCIASIFIYPKKVGTELISFSFAEEFPTQPRWLCRIQDY